MGGCLKGGIDMTRKYQSLIGMEYNNISLVYLLYTQYIDLSTVVFMCSFVNQQDLSSDS